MKYNPLLNEIARGVWAMSFDGLAFWGPIANKIMSGESINLKEGAEMSIMNVFDDRGRRVAAEEDGTFNAPKGSVAVVYISGVLIKYGDWCTYGAQEIVDRLWAAERNPNIVGIVAVFDGPGGAVSAIAPFVDFGMRKTKPVVGLYDQCCSAHAYSMYSFCDHIMAENNISATIGSFGVVLTFRDNREYLEKMGIKTHEIYPDESEDKNKSFMLALKGEYDLIKTEMLSPLAVKFQEAVKAARPKMNLAVPGVLTGKTFYADQALEIGLIDSKGNLYDAMDRVRIMGEMKSLYKH